ncbi:MAG: zinc ribbon domain-containing protein [Myxococcota bacterium]|nr:zinc ribbon domain-containing protein [Myxococcota bacterium]
MPLYEYVCEQCAEEFEVVRRASDTEPVRCPKCAGDTRKLLSGFAVRALRSGGWGSSGGGCSSSGGG